MEQRSGFLNRQTYILGIELSREISIPIGELGNVIFKKGFYLYIGSAKKRLNARLKRHLSKDKKLFWHIDYLLAHRKVFLKNIWVSEDKGECLIAQLIHQKLKSKIINGFGSSDCRCLGHLLFIDSNNSLEKFLKSQKFEKISLNYVG